MDVPELLEQYAQEIFQAQSGIRALSGTGKRARPLCDNLRYMSDRLERLARNLRAAGITDIEDAFGENFWKSKEEQIFADLPTALDE